MIGISRGGPFGPGGQTRRCGFCARREDVVEHLVRARGAYICNRCVDQAREAIGAAAAGQRLLRIRPAPARVADRDAAEAEVERAFEAVFSADTPVAERCAAVEHGGNLAASMQEAADRYPDARALDVVVDYVRFVSDDEAEVRFTLLVPSFGPSGLAQTGHAVRVGERWKVSRGTWCGIVRLAGVECPPPEADESG